MLSSFSDYRVLTAGLTQQDRQFRDALKELSGEDINFYNERTSAENRLNHLLAGADIEPQHPVDVVGMIDYTANTLTMMYHGDAIEYNLDEIDPRYLATINQVVGNDKKKKLEQLPITDIAAEMLDDIHPDIENKPKVDEHSLSDSRQVLNRAFANEMVFQVALEDYIKDHDLQGLLDENHKELSDLVNKTTFEASFNDGLEDLTKKANEMQKNEDKDMSL